MENCFKWSNSPPFGSRGTPSRGSLSTLTLLKRVLIILKARRSQVSSALEDTNVGGMAYLVAGVGVHRPFRVLGLAYSVGGGGVP